MKSPTLCPKTSNWFNNFELDLVQILSLQEAKSSSQALSKNYCCTEGQYLAQMKFQITKKIDASDQTGMD